MLSAESKSQAALTIAIDGPAGAGKSTVARRVAQQLGYLYIDTGAMYRAATVLALRHSIDVGDELAVANLVEKSKMELIPGQGGGADSNAGGVSAVQVFVEGVDVTDSIRTAEVSRLVSTVAALASVREQLVEKQRLLARGGAVVLEGRDIGTVVLPKADVKIFLTASAEVRAKRRYKELVQAKQVVDFQQLLQDIVDRDYKDAHREVSPLISAPDAVHVSSDDMDIDQVVQSILRICEETADRACPKGK